MAVSTSIHTLKYKHSTSTVRSRALTFAEECRKRRKVLLKSIFKLFAKAEASSRNAKSNEAIQSIQHCKHWLADFLNSLQQTQQGLLKFGPVSSNIDIMPHNTKTGRIYIHSLRKLIHGYNRYLDARHPKALKVKMKRKLNRILTENMVAMQYVIQMMQVFIRKAGKRMKRNKESMDSPRSEPLLKMFNSGLKQIKSQESREYSDIRSEDEKQSGWSSSNAGSTTYNLHKAMLFTGNRPYDLNQFRRVRVGNFSNVTKGRVKASSGYVDDSILSGKKMLLSPSFTKVNAFADQIDFYSMEKAASVIINHLFAKKAAPFEMITKNYHEPRPGDELLEEVWRDLITEHNRMMLFPGKRNLSQMQDELTTFYLNKLQLAFQAQLTNQALNKSSKKSGGFFQNTKNYVLDIKQMPLGKVSFHHLLCDAQMKRLRRSRFNPDLPNMLKMLVAEELPRTRSTQELLRLYENDPQHYNVLLMSCDHNITHKGASLLNFIEHKFESLKEKFAREKRRSGLKLAFTNPDRSVNSEEKSASPTTKNEFVLDDEYCREVREKWVKYFAEQEKTPIMLHLEEERRKKIERARELKEERRLQRLELANSRRKSRPITALYSSPRLTHRMREAINRLAEEARLSPAEYVNPGQSEPNAPSNTSVASSEEYETGPTLADIILNSESMTSCCSKCRNQADIVHYGPVLERFFRTHDEIIAHGNDFCNSPDEDMDLRGIHYQE